MQPAEFPVIEPLDAAPRPPGDPTAAAPGSADNNGPSGGFGDTPDELFMAVALGLAREAGEAGEVPVGAVVVIDGQVAGTGANRRQRDVDPTAHAEILALRAAASAIGSWRLGGATLFVTLEPCPMCAGAVVNARVDRVVFAAADPKAGACGSLYNLCVDPRLNHEVEVTPGVLGLEGGALLSGWFATRRRRP